MLNRIVSRLILLTTLMALGAPLLFSQQFQAEAAACGVRFVASSSTNNLATRYLIRAEAGDRMSCTLSRYRQLVEYDDPVSESNSANSDYQEIWMMVPDGDRPPTTNAVKIVAPNAGSDAGNATIQVSCENAVISGNGTTLAQVNIASENQSCTLKITASPNGIQTTIQAKLSRVAGVYQMEDVNAYGGAYGSEAPQFTSPGPASEAGLVEVAENTTEVVNVEATDDLDSEGDGLVYSIYFGDDGELFKIDENTGLLEFKEAPDFETPQGEVKDNTYTVTVAVTDSSNQKALRGIRIIVTDAANEPGETPGSVTAEASSADQPTAPPPPTGTITIVQNVNGPDASVGFSSATSDLNFSLATSGGTTRTTVSDVAVGTHTITATDLSGAGYALSSVSCRDSDSTGDVASRSVTIALAADEEVICTFTNTETRKHSSQMIAGYLGGRNTLLMASQPNRASGLSRLKGGNSPAPAGQVSAFGFGGATPLPFNLQVSNHAASFSTSMSSLSAISLALNDGAPGLLPRSSPWDVWVEGQFSRFDDETSKGGTFGLVSAGVDYLVNSNLLVGVMAQYDKLDQEFGEGLLDPSKTAEVSGTGWMVGPYAAVRLIDFLYLDARATWGRSDNDFNPFGTYEDNFETERMIAAVGLTGDFNIGNWNIQPGVAFQFIREEQEAYLDGMGVFIPEQTISQGDVRFGPRIGYTYEHDEGVLINPWIEFNGVYSFSKEGKFAAGSYASELEGLTGTLMAGFSVTDARGVNILVSGRYDGIGANAEAYGASLKLTVPLN